MHLEVKKQSFEVIPNRDQLTRRLAFNRRVLETENCHPRCFRRLFTIACENAAIVCLLARGN